mgnify:CR=1 FL=1
MSELGKFIRKKRKDQGLRLEDLADEHISTATISNIERGVPHVNREKISYLMEKLNLDIDEVSKMLLEDNENMESMQLKFTAIDTLLSLGKVDKASRFLMNIPAKFISHHQASIHLLKGRAYLQQRDWHKAERELSDAIRLAERDRYAQKINLLALCYLDLATCRYLQYDLKHALQFIERGIQALRKDREDYQQVRYRLLTNQVTYLERSGFTDEALKRLNQLWLSLDSIQELSIILKMHIIRAKLLRKVKLYHDAIKCARKGIQLAVGSYYYEELFHLWMILGMTYLDLYQLENAEICFAFVGDLEDQVNSKKEVIRAYCSLSYLYLLKNELDEAERSANEAARLSDRHPNQPIRDYVWILCGQIEKKRGNWEKAARCFQQAIQIASKQKASSSLLQSYVELAECYQKLEKEEEFVETITQIYRLQKKLHGTEQLSPQWQS